MLQERFVEVDPEAGPAAGEPKATTSQTDSKSPGPHAL
jgi:hypothetical protein